MSPVDILVEDPFPFGQPIILTVAHMGISLRSSS